MFLQRNLYHSLFEVTFNTTLLLWQRKFIIREQTGFSFRYKSLKAKTKHNYCIWHLKTKRRKNKLFSLGSEGFLERLENSCSLSCYEDDHAKIVWGRWECAVLYLLRVCGSEIILQLSAFSSLQTWYKQIFCNCPNIPASSVNPSQSVCTAVEMMLILLTIHSLSPLSISGENKPLSKFISGLALYRKLVSIYRNLELWGLGCSYC